MMTIDNIHLPLQVERGVTGGPAFFTTMQTTPNGIKSSVQSREQALYSWNVGLIGLRDDEIREMYKFFFGRRGPAYGFLFKDWSDYQMPIQTIGTGDGVETDFQLINIYDDAVRPYSRYITRPVSGTLEVYLDDTIQTLTTHYTVANGVVTFLAAPASSVDITALCEFDIAAQFTDDQLTVQMLHSTQGLVPTFKLEEINEYAQL